MNKAASREQQVRKLLRTKRFAEARQLCLQWVDRQPDNPDAWFFKAYAETSGHLDNAALHSIERALALKPRDTRFLVRKADILGIIGQSRQCLEIIDELLSGADLPAAQLYQIGSTLNNIGAHERALQLFERVNELAPGKSANLVSLGTTYHYLARNEEAAAALLEAIKLDPERFQAYWFLGRMLKATPGNNRVALFTETLKRYANSLIARIYLNFALAKQHEELGDYARAFAHLQEGSAAVLEHTPYDIEWDRKFYRAVKSAFGEAFFQSGGEGCESNEPIFVLGMPRTGTTLLEQIITTYDGIETAGELRHFIHLFTRACNRHNMRADLSTVFTYADRVDWRELGESYLANARMHIGDSPRFIDKNPINFMMVGPILRALPQARIINLQRNPMDTCFSNYKLLFNLGVFLHTYDLKTMGEYYCRYREIMQHWHACAPGRILDVQYESLVTRPEETTREVSDFLGLEWDRRCLDFYKSGAAVSTASVAQVRQPINTESLYKWRKFEPQLAPLVDFFRERGIRIDA